MTQIPRTILSPLKMSSLSSSSSEGAACKSHLPHCRYMIMRFLLCLTVHPIPLWLWTRGPDFWFRGPAVASEMRSSFSTQGLADAPRLSSLLKVKAQIDLGSASSYLQIFSPKPLILLPYQPHLLSVNPQCPLFLIIWNRNPSQFT